MSRGFSILLCGTADGANLTNGYSLAVSVVADNLVGSAATCIAKYSGNVESSLMCIIELRTTAVAYNLPNRVGMLNGFDIVYPAVTSGRNGFRVGIFAAGAGVSAHTRR